MYFESNPIKLNAKVVQEMVETGLHVFPDSLTVFVADEGLLVYQVKSKNEKVFAPAPKLTMEGPQTEEPFKAVGNPGETAELVITAYQSCVNYHRERSYTVMVSIVQAIAY